MDIVSEGGCANRGMQTVVCKGKCGEGCVEKVVECGEGCSENDVWRGVCGEGFAERGVHRGVCGEGCLESTVVRREMCRKGYVGRGVERGMGGWVGKGVWVWGGVGKGVWVWGGVCGGLCLLWEVVCAGWSEIEGMDELPFPICEIVLPGLCLN